VSTDAFLSVAVRKGRTIVGRLLPGTDLIGGLEAVCDEHRIRYASIDSAYGSLGTATFKCLHQPADADAPAVLMPQTIDHRVEFLAGQGLVCDDGGSGRVTHLHGAVSDATGQVLGGHFEPSVNPVYNNLDFVVTELLGARLSRRWEAETNTVEMVVTPLEEE
jgi:predicted DNA-binding protein with PD1-like motif